MRTIPVEYLREALSYNAETGVLTWRVRPRDHFKTSGHWRRWNGRYANRVAGCRAAYGYRRVAITFNGTEQGLLEHRLAWVISTGVWPLHEIDHTNGVRNDNRLCNLREATIAEQQQNRKKIAVNTTGFTGVSWHKRCRKWIAHIGVGGRLRHLGYFPSPGLAHESYLAAKRELHPFQPVPRGLPETEKRV